MTGTLVRLIRSPPTASHDGQTQGSAFLYQLPPGCPIHPRSFVRLTSVERESQEKVCAQVRLVHPNAQLVALGDSGLGLEMGTAIFSQTGGRLAGKAFRVAKLGEKVERLFHIWNHTDKHGGPRKHGTLRRVGPR